MGRVRIPSSTERAPGHFLIERRAAKIPRKKESTVATIPVFNDIHRVLQSRFFRISVSSFMVPPLLSYLSARRGFSPASKIDVSFFVLSFCPRGICAAPRFTCCIYLSAETYTACGPPSFRHGRFSHEFLRQAVRQPAAVSCRIHPYQSNNSGKSSLPHPKGYSSRNPRQQPSRRCPPRRSLPARSDK